METKRKSLEMAQTFTTDLVRRAIKSCRNSKAFGPNKLSIFHLKHLGHRAIKYITTLLNLSVTTCQIPAIWKSSLIIPIPKPAKDTSLRTSYRPISLLCLAAKALESLMLPTINKYLQPAPDQHDFRPDHSTTWALLQMTTDIAMGFNQRKPPDWTICVAVDISTAFDTGCHNNLLSKINRSQLPPPPRHSVITVMLSDRKTSQDLLQRCILDVKESQHRRPASLQTVSVNFQLLHWDMPKRQSRWSGSAMLMT